MNTYVKGSTVRVSFEFRLLSDNSLVDPVAVGFKWKRGAGGTVTTLVFAVDAGLVQLAVGQYYVDMDASEVGIYYTRGYGTGTGAGASEREFEVVSQFP
jgi:hypothetical protein